jgi:hypothetical protein
VRGALLGLALVVLGVALVQSGRSDAPDTSVPAWIPTRLGEIAIRIAPTDDFAIEREAAVAVVRASVFLGDGPDEDPFAVSMLATGRIARAAIAPSPTGEVDVPVVENLPAWLVVWRGLDGGTLDDRFGARPEGSRVDAVFLVDGQTGDCCWFTRFLSGASRLR